MIPPNVLEGKPLGIVVDHADAPTTAPALGESWGLSFGEDMTPSEGGAITGVVTTIHLEADRSRDQRSPSGLKLAVRSHGRPGTGPFPSI